MAREWGGCSQVAVSMDPTNSSSMKTFQLCELSSCTDLPVLEEDQFPVFSDSESTASSSSEEDSGLFMLRPSKRPEKILTLGMVNEGIKVMSYAVRGPLLLRANELEKEIASVRSCLLFADCFIS